MMFSDKSNQILVGSAWVVSVAGATFAIIHSINSIT